MPRVTNAPPDASTALHGSIGIAVRVTCKNDVNGNPRRGWMVYRRSGAYAGFVAEGYQGARALDAAVTHLYDGMSWTGRAYEHLSEVGGVEITPRQYRTLDRDRFPLVTA